MNRRKNGSIKNWNAERQTGWIKVDNFKYDARITLDNVIGEIDPGKIKPGNKVCFELEPTLDKYIAKKIRFIKGVNRLQEGRNGRRCTNTDSREHNSRNSSDDKGAEVCFIPRDTKRLLEHDGDICENLNLFCNKLIFYENDKGSKNNESNKKISLGTCMREYERKKENVWKKNFGHISNLYLKRQERILEEYTKYGYEIYKRQFTLDWRLAIGLGQASVYETSINLHHIYGIPFIPASSFKGTIRSWVISNYFEGDEIGALSDSFFVFVFGSDKSNKAGEERKDQKGGVVFFDVYPSEFPQISMDIMNTHYTEYYQNGMDSPPGDYSNPDIVNFLTVKNIGFYFAVGVLQTDPNFHKNQTTFEGQAKTVIDGWIGEALNYQGIGAKTSTGYGYFSTK